MGYYRLNAGKSTIELNASIKTQLGINVNDLDSKQADGTIGVVGVYDFSNVAAGEAMLSNATAVTFTLGLQKRTEDGSYTDVDISKYLAVTNSSLEASAPQDGKITFTETKAAGDTFKARTDANPALKLSITVKVDTNVEGNGLTYDNYRLVLSAGLSGNGISDTPINATGASGYDHSDYVTYTLTKINLSGIPHK